MSEILSISLGEHEIATLLNERELMPVTSLSLCQLKATRSIVKTINQVVNSTSSEVFEGISVLETDSSTDGSCDTSLSGSGTSSSSVAGLIWSPVELCGFNSLASYLTRENSTGYQHDSSYVTTISNTSSGTTSNTSFSSSSTLPFLDL